MLKMHLIFLWKCRELVHLSRPIISQVLTPRLSEAWKHWDIKSVQWSHLWILTWQSLARSRLDWKNGILAVPINLAPQSVNIFRNRSIYWEISDFCPTLKTYSKSSNVNKICSWSFLFLWVFTAENNKYTFERDILKLNCVVYPTVLVENPI